MRIQISPPAKHNFLFFFIIIVLDYIFNLGYFSNRNRIHIYIIYEYKYGILNLNNKL